MESHREAETHSRRDAYSLLGFSLFAPFAAFLQDQGPLTWSLSLPAVALSLMTWGMLLAVALPQWPYARDCGGWLILYLVAVGMVVIAGIWGARLTWDGRLGYAHIIALGTVLWGLTLTSQEVLPRIGYAQAQAAWFCAP